MATSESEENKKTDAAKKDGQLRNQTLTAAIAANFLIKLGLGGLVLLFWIWIASGRDTNSPSYEGNGYEPLVLLFLACSFFIAALWAFARYLRLESPQDNNLFAVSSKFALRRPVEEFPLELLACDILIVSLLVAVTGQLESVFEPLLLVALVLGDISVISKRKYKYMAVIFTVVVLSAILLPEFFDPVLHPLINWDDSTSRDSVWVLPTKHAEKATIGIGLAFFLAGALGGSWVLRWYKDLALAGTALSTE